MARDIETVRKSKREHMARKRAADPEAARAYSRSYHQANREKTTAKMREYYERRFFWGRAMKLRGSNRATVSDISRLWYAQRGKCALTGGGGAHLMAIPSPTQTWTTKHPHVQDRHVVGVGPDYVLYERGDETKIRRLSMKNWTAWVRGNQAVPALPAVPDDPAEAEV